jgi:hypothetical protein
MTEVSEFLSANEFVSSALKKFAIQYDRLSDVWINCEHPDWMLDLLKRNCNWKRDYRFNDGLMNYVRSLRETAALHYGEPNPSVEHYFNFESGVDSTRKEMESRDISVLEGERRCFIWLWMVADEATRYVFEDEIDRFEFDKVTEKITAEHMEIEPITDDRNEIEFRRSLLKKQADQLRSAIPNPFR